MKRLRRNRRGTALPSAALALLTVAGLTVAAIEAGYLYFTDAELQTAADSAAIAGAQALPHADDVHGAVTGASPPTGRHGAVVPDKQVVVGRWDQDNGVFTPGAGPANAVRVTVSRSAAEGNAVPTVFTSLLGMGGVDLKAEAIAAKIRDPICMLALDPVGHEVVRVHAGAKIAALDCAIRVNSSAARAVAIGTGSTVTAETICIHGESAGLGFAPPPDRCPPVDDPLAGLTPPSNSGAPCDFVDTVIDKGEHQLLPGVYCGRLKIGAGAMVTFLPGAYMIRDAEFAVAGGADVAGAGVMFHLAGRTAALRFEAGSTVRFSAPTMGPMAGILVYQDRDVAPGSAHRIDADSASCFEGVIYLPGAVLQVNGEGPINGGAAFTVLIARSFEIGPHRTILLNSNYDASSVPLPDGLGRHVILAR